MHYDIVILADGDFPTHPIAKRILDEASILVCCDNAGRKLIESLGRIPDAIVGDGDSLPSEFKEEYSNIYHQVDEQDYNDLTKATRYVVENYKKEGKKLNVAYLGASGKREDHTIGNVSLMEFYRREMEIIPAMITDFGIFTPHHGDDIIQTFQRQQVSIFNLSSTNMSSKGLKWEISSYAEWWQGTLNEALSDSISIYADGSYIVYLTHEAKG